MAIIQNEINVGGGQMSSEQVEAVVRNAVTQVLNPPPASAAVPVRPEYPPLTDEMPCSED